MEQRKSRVDSDLTIFRSDDTLRSRTVFQLREAIVTHYFKPGDRLVEGKLCTLTGVSRTTIREALRQLEAEGLVDIIPQRGPVVASLDPEDARSIYELREALEAMAARLFVEKADDAELKALSEAAERCKEMIANRDGRATAAQIEVFTGILFRGSRNTMIAQTMRVLAARLHYLRAITTARQSDAQISASLANLDRIVACALRRDAHGTAEACVARVRNAAKVALAMLAEEEAGKASARLT